MLSLKTFSLGFALRVKEGPLANTHHTHTKAVSESLVIVGGSVEHTTVVPYSYMRQK